MARILCSLLERRTCRSSIENLGDNNLSVEETLVQANQMFGRTSERGRVVKRVCPAQLQSRASFHTTSLQDARIRRVEKYQVNRFNAITLEQR
jgi:hypothetical protein